MSQIQATIPEYTQSAPSIQPQSAAVSQPDRDSLEADVININPAISRDILKPENNISAGQEGLDLGELVENLNPPEEENNEERFDLIDQLTDYEYSRFAERILEKFPQIFSKYEKCSNDELNTRINICKTWVLKKGAQKRVETAFRGVLNICDRSLSLLGFNVDGTSQVLVNDPDVLDTIEEIRLKRRSKLYTEPEYRL